MKADQERVKNLLIDTVTLLCKNSLTYQDELCVEGLLGVKVDQKNVFFVHISQTFQNELSSSLPSDKSSKSNEQLTDTETRTQELQHNEQVSEGIHVKREHKDEFQAANLDSRTGSYSPRTRDPSTVNAQRADVVAGQRRVHSQHSRHHGHRTSSSTGDSPRGLTCDGVSSSPVGDLLSEQLTSGENHQEETDNDLFSEPPIKKRVKSEVFNEDGSSLLGADGMDDMSPWPNIGGQTAGSLGMMAAQMAQSMARNFEGNHSPSNDAVQPGCSAWPFPSGLVPPSPTDMVSPGPRLPVGGGSEGPPLGLLLSAARGPRMSNWREFPCEVCGKVFHMSHHLRQHVRIHTGERPYRCDTCGATFTQISSLNRHQRGQHGDKSFGKPLGGITQEREQPHQFLGLGKDSVDEETNTANQREETVWGGESTAVSVGETPVMESQPGHVTRKPSEFGSSPPGGGQYLCTDCNIEFRHYEQFACHVKESHPMS